MRIADTHLRPAANNFTLVRLVLASAVIWTHSFWLATGISGQDELSHLLGEPISVFAVDGFFFLSGFLVYASLLRRRGPFAFIKARFLRLWPAMAVSVLGTVAVGAFVTTAAPAQYLAGDTARFVGGNLSFLKASYSLTGVGCDMTPCILNGSLWTIPWEVRCYALLVILSVIGLANERAMRFFVLPATLVVVILWHLPAVHAFAETTLGPGAVYALDMADRLWSMFALGIATYLWRDRIVLSWWVLALLFAASTISLHLGAATHLDSLFTAYGVLCFGFLTARNGAVSGNWPDYSYGMYIYAFPLMIALNSLFGFAHHGLLALANFAVTLPMAALSWHFVEKPALTLARSAGTRASASVVAPTSGT